MGNGDSDQFGEIVLKQEGGYVLPENWTGALPEELREDPTLKNISDLPGMAKMLVNAQKMVGRDKIVIPGEGATDEQWGEVFAKLGRPDTADEYGLLPPENLPEGMVHSPEMMKAFGDVAHKLNLLPWQVKGLHDWYNEAAVKGFKDKQNADNQVIQEAENAIREKYGNAYPEKLELGKRAFLSFVGEDNAEALNTKYGNDPLFISFCVAVGEAMSEDKLKGRTTPVFTPSEAQAQLDTIMGDRTHPYWHKESPGHTQAVKTVQQLNDAIYGTDTAGKGFDVKVTG